MTKQFRGSHSVTVTPFTSDGKSIDEAALKRFLDWQIACGVPGVIILGTTGEFLTITDEERRQYVEATVKHVAGRMLVMVGTMNAYTPNAVRYSREAEELGADGLMIVPPYYYTPTHDEIFNYYKAISEAVTIPIMLYNNPVTTNVDMPAKLVARMTKAFENVRYIKEASMDVGRVYDIVEQTQGVMNVFAGERVVESYRLGAVGYVNPYGNYIPRASARIWDYLVSGRLDDAKAIQVLINRMDHIIAEGHPTYGHQCYSKALAAAAGYPMGDVREPLTKFADLGAEGIARREKLVAIMGELDALMDRLEVKAA
ncbi:dihydrodipicolinate synthase family protein [Labrys monachus]|uniref:4-hydroxy-tetrahydrodipicolinate synthase n=1 Tax=Labrys monachus TaxID=217067 RepID=A0ABU0F7B1_9HYPH|nr:dihydrodipicolinate synthase family protein [Labrys monachus]MDQ0390504.1 4-hydroxy-tetrahydrodipicolinate synthase [Labrys monachus]